MSESRRTEILENFQEGLTKYNATICSDHAYIHQGIAFTSIINTGSISAAYDIGFTTPTAEQNKFVHWRPVGIYSSADFVLYELREGDTYSSGTAVTPINRNRNSVNTALTSMAYNVTSTPTGTLIQSAGVGTAGGPVARAGGGSGAENELVLKPNTNYVITLTPAAATTVILELFWYEESGFEA